MGEKSRRENVLVPTITACYTAASRTSGWSGAALVDSKGTIVGVGSLLLAEAIPGRQQLWGNMFVPIDALKPILGDLIKAGRRQSAPRPWLGVGADELYGRLIVSQVSPEGPADKAGVKKGDIILGVGNDPVRSRAELYERLWKSNRAGDVIKLRMLQGAEIREVDVQSIGRDDYFRTTGSGPSGTSHLQRLRPQDGPTQSVAVEVVSSTTDDMPGMAAGAALGADRVIPAPGWNKEVKNPVASTPQPADD